MFLLCFHKFVTEIPTSQAGVAALVLRIQGVIPKIHRVVRLTALWGKKFGFGFVFESVAGLFDGLFQLFHMLAGF